MAGEIRLAKFCRFEDCPKKKLPSQEKLIKGKTVGTSHGSKKMYRFRFLGKENPKNTHCESVIV